MDAIITIRRRLKEVEAALALLEGLRRAAKTDGGRMTEFGRALLAAARDAELKQSFVAKLLEISPGAVSQHYNK
jgi:hypothetical protein